MAEFTQPLLRSSDNPDGVCLEELLEQIIDELRAKNAEVPSRETSMVITSVEQALLWQLRRGMVCGNMRAEGAPDTCQAGFKLVPRRFLGHA